MNLRRQISSQQRLPGSYLIVAPADPLAVVFHASEAKQDSSTGIGSLRQLLGNLQGRRTELRNRDAIVHERRA